MNHHTGETMRRILTPFVFLPAILLGAKADEEKNAVVVPESPLQYRPDHGDFVIENGREYFNRPLYGTNTAFRVDGGDLPQWSLYLPGRGGNLRLGMVSMDSSVRWLDEAENIIARYRPGAMRHEIQGATPGDDSVLWIDSIPCADAEGVILRIRAENLSEPVTLGWVFGGANGKRGRRDGDIGTESVPISRYFQFSVDQAKGNHIALQPDGSFELTGKPGRMIGMSDPRSDLRIVDASSWNAPFQSPAANDSPQPVLAGTVELSSSKPVFLCIGRNLALDPEAPLAKQFDLAEEKRIRLQNQVRVQTPDPYLDASVGALNLAADAVWDESQGVVMHGAVAWRQPLLGWRGPYVNDALGWHDRARRHFSYWAKQQKTGEIPATLPPPEEETHLSRSRKALHSPGAMSFNHYDMNLVYIDALFRHLMWTGDLAYAREMWPVILRHLEWERRLFRREFGPEQLPLYEAYAAIWASDNMHYHGGGVSYSSAYNHWHQLMAAKIARMIGEDPKPFETEAAAIAKAMRTQLWVGETGMFGESKDLLGLQRVHPAAGLWTFYHTMDAGLVTPEEAWSMTRYVEREIPRLPVRGPGVPDGLAMYASSNWMPYVWSVNNVVMGENLHTALGFWQAGRPETAYHLMRSSLLASLFMGICPGNIGSMNYLDAYRRESQRDFADGSGVFSRALVEGLFGVHPDFLSGSVRFAPGFPVGWDHAEMHHPDFDLEFLRKCDTDRYLFKFKRDLQLHLDLPKLRETVAITCNGKPLEVRTPEEWNHLPRVTAASGEKSRRFEIVVNWSGKTIDTAEKNRPVPTASPDYSAFLAPPPPEPGSRLEPIDLTALFNDKVTALFAPNQYRTPRSPFVSLAVPSHGFGSWASEVHAKVDIDDSGLRALSSRSQGVIRLPSSVPFATPGEADARNIAFVSQWDRYPRELTVPVTGKARRLHFLLAGSTNWMQSRFDNGEIIATYQDGASVRLPLRNPETWWPIEQDYHVDGLAFRRSGPAPVRIDLKTGRIRQPGAEDLRKTDAMIPGGSAMVLSLPLDPEKPLRSVTIRALANEVVIGCMAATVER